ncbi:MAG TPA: NUDIX hydrolase [Streptosporangiaceae bacterium]
MAGGGGHGGLAGGDPMAGGGGQGGPAEGNRAAGAGSAVGNDDLRDVRQRWPVAGDSRYAHGALVALRTDQVRMPNGELAARDVVEHPGAVAIVALDSAGRVLLIRQYRHPVGWLLWEVPAGLRDVDGEPLRATAERELLEETGYSARQWNVLSDYFSSPGIITERLRVFLARDLTQVPRSAHDYQRRHEEAHLLQAWVPLAQAVQLILAGRLHNGVAAIGILAAYAAHTGGFAALREADARED